MKYCSQCGHATEQAIPPGDNRERAVCPSCGHVQYNKPSILVSTVAIWEDKILWMQRATAPRKGYWAMPSGFMEQGETLQEAASRELFEETSVVIPPTDLNLYAVGSIPFINEVYVVFRGWMTDPACYTSDEAMAVGLFNEQDAPWDALAYPIVERHIRQYYRELENHQFGVHVGEVTTEGTSAFNAIERMLGEPPTK